jgi:hypothetical protein
MACGLGSAASAQSTNAPTATGGAPAARLPDVVVVGEAESSETVQGPFLPDIQDTRINAGKKTSVLDLDELPKVSNNNYRQALDEDAGPVVERRDEPAGQRRLPRVGAAPGAVHAGFEGRNPHSRGSVRLPGGLLHAAAGLRWIGSSSSAAEPP